MILSILVNAAALFVAAQLLSGITVADTGTLLLAALAAGIPAQVTTFPASAAFSKNTPNSS